MFNKIATYQKRNSRGRLNKWGDILKVNEWGALIYGTLILFSLLCKALKIQDLIIKGR